MQGGGCQGCQLLEQGIVRGSFLYAGPAQLGHEGRMKMKTKTRCFFLGRKEDCNTAWVCWNNLELLRQCFRRIKYFHIRQIVEFKSDRHTLFLKSFDRFRETQKL